jgi:hypothetical protein
MNRSVILGMKSTYVITKGKTFRHSDAALDACFNIRCGRNPATMSSTRARSVEWNKLRHRGACQSWPSSAGATDPVTCARPQVERRGRRRGGTPYFSATSSSRLVHSWAGTGSPDLIRPRDGQSFPGSSQCTPPVATGASHLDEAARSNSSPPAAGLHHSRGRRARPGKGSR